MPDAAALVQYQEASALNVPIDWVPINPGVDPLERPVRALRATTEGTITVTTATGDSRVMAFLAGETRFVIATHVTAATSTGIEGGI